MQVGQGRKSLPDNFYDRVQLVPPDIVVVEREPQICDLAIVSQESPHDRKIKRPRENVVELQVYTPDKRREPVLRDQVLEGALVRLKVPHQEQLDLPTRAQHSSFPILPVDHAISLHEVSQIVLVSERIAFFDVDLCELSILVRQGLELLKISKKYHSSLQLFCLKIS